MSVIKIASRSSLPKLNQRKTTMPAQPHLFHAVNRIHATVVYGFDDDPATVAFMYILFLDEDWNYLPEFIDLLALIRTPVSRVTIEKIADAQPLPLRGPRKIRQPKRKPELGS